MTNSISLALSVIARKGDTIAVESPVYFGILQLANSMGLRVLELPTNPVTGIEPDALRKVLPQINLCLLISNFSNPLGSCMPDEHKKEVVQMLAEYNIPLIEDDLYGDVFFRHSRPKPCKAFDEKGLVLWCGSVSKTLAPGYRVGWIAPGKFKDAVIRQKHIHLISTPTLNQEAIANFMENGRYENHLRRLRHELHSNSLHLAQSITDYFPEDTKIITPQGGFMLWVELNKKIDTTELYYKATQDQHCSRTHVYTARPVQKLYAFELRSAMESFYRRTLAGFRKRYQRIILIGGYTPLPPLRESSALSLFCLQAYWSSLF